MGTKRFEVLLDASARKELITLQSSGRPEFKRVARILQRLEGGPTPDSNAVPLVGEAGVYRYKVGRLRVIYECDAAEKRIIVRHIRLRDEKTYRDT